MTRKYVTLGMVAVVAVLSLSETARGAGDRIVPRKAVGLVKIGMTLSAVQAVLPGYKNRPNQRWGTFRGLSLTFSGVKPAAVLKGIQTTSKRYQTRGGVRVGSSVSKVRTEFPGLKCIVFNYVDDRGLLAFDFKYASDDLRPGQCSDSRWGARHGRLRECHDFFIYFSHPDPASTRTPRVESFGLGDALVSAKRGHCGEYCDTSRPVAKGKFQSCLTVTALPDAPQDTAR